MSLSDLAALGSFISGLAVLASLGFLYFQMRQMAEQVRQAERNQRAANVLQTISFSNAFNVGLMQPELSRIQLKLVRGDMDLTEVETMQALNLVSRCVSNALGMNELDRLGLSDRQLAPIVGNALRAVIASPGFRAMWPMVRRNYPLEALGLVEGLMAEVPLRPPTDLAAFYRTRLATLMADNEKTNG